MVIKYYDFDYGGCTAHIYEYNRYYVVPTGTHILDWDSVNYKPKRSVVDYHEKCVVDGVLNKPVAFMSESGANSFCYGKPAGVERYTSGRGEEIVDDFLKEEFDNAILYFRQNFGKYKKEDMSMDRNNEVIQETSERIQRDSEELMNEDPVYAHCFNKTNASKSEYNYECYKINTFNSAVGKIVNGLSQIKDALHNLSTSNQSFIESNVKISDRVELSEDFYKVGTLPFICKKHCISYNMVQKIANLPIEYVPVVYGAGGTGKSYLASHFGEIACYIREQQFNKRYTGYRVARIDCSGISRNTFSGGLDAVSNYVQGDLEKIFDVASKDKDTLYLIVLDEILDITEYRSVLNIIWSKLGNKEAYLREVPKNTYIIGTGNNLTSDTKTITFSNMLEDTGCNGRFLFLEIEPTYYKDGVVYIDELKEVLRNIRYDDRCFSDSEIEDSLELLVGCMEDAFKLSKKAIIPVRALDAALNGLRISEKYAKERFKALIIIPKEKEVI